MTNAEAFARFATNAFAPLLLDPGVARYPLRSTEGFVGYYPAGSLIVALGEPVCDPGHLREATAEFEAWCEAQGRDVLYALVRKPFLDAVATPRALVVPIGEDLKALFRAR